MTNREGAKNSERDYHHEQISPAPQESVPSHALGPTGCHGGYYMYYNFKYQGITGPVGIQNENGKIDTLNGNFAPQGATGIVCSTGEKWEYFYGKSKKDEIPGIIKKDGPNHIQNKDSNNIWSLDEIALENNLNKLNVSDPLKITDLKPVPLTGRDVQTYAELSNFVGALVNIGAVNSKDFIAQVSKCEKWSTEQFKHVSSIISSHLKYNSTVPFSQVKEAIDKANNSVRGPGLQDRKLSFRIERSSNTNGLSETLITYNNKTYSFTIDISPEEKAEYLDALIADGFSEDYLDKISFPELTKEDIDHWKTKNNNICGILPTLDINKSKKDIKNAKEIEKINRLLENKKVQIKDLDKYVALGIISSSGLKAWRVEDQVKNNYFYDEIIDDSVYDELKKAVNLAIDEKSLESDKFKSEVNRAVYRVAGKQVNDITRAAIIKALPDDKVDGMKSFLASELGSSFVGMVGGITLERAMENNKIAQALSKELRVSSLATLGNEAVDFLTQGLASIIKNALVDLPTTNKEVSITDEKIEEDLSLLYEEENKQQLIC